MIRVKTDKKFIQDKTKVLKYLESRNVKDNEYLLFIQQLDFGLLEDNIFYIDDEEYTLDYFYSNSDVNGYDIIQVNKNLNLASGSILAIANVHGEDIICLNTCTNEILLWELESGVGDMVHIADSFHEFEQMLDFEYN